MKRLALVLPAAVLLVAFAAGSGLRARWGDVETRSDAKNPWNHLRLNNDDGEFQFLVISDRTGGHRSGIFGKAVQKINLLQPEFVVSVGDLIEGYTENRAELESQWNEFNGFIGQLKMPFFYVPGNHDVTNRVMTQYWQEQFGRTYYHFVYKNVLFLMLNTEDPPEGRKGTWISPAQIDYVRKALADNKGVRWTVVCLHKPIWVYPDNFTMGWPEVEKALLEGDRQFTVFAGHVHRYEKFVRNGRNYYQLATTGGGSKLRGEQYGEFDHVTWVTMKKEGPLLANLRLDGILAENLVEPKVKESGAVERERLECLPVRGRVYFNGQPAAGANIVFHRVDPRNNRLRRAGDALVDAEGGFLLSTYTANDGAPAGEYKVTVVWYDRPNPAERGTGPNKLPARYASPETSGLAAEVKVGSNDFLFNLKD